MAKKGLGSGLNALFGEDTELREEAGLLTLPISKVEPAADQPRERFEPEALEQLADSIRQHGVCSPSRSVPWGAGITRSLPGSAGGGRPAWRAWTRSPPECWRRTTAPPGCWPWWKTCSART